MMVSILSYLELSLFDHLAHYITSTIIIFSFYFCCEQLENIGPFTSHVQLLENFFLIASKIIFDHLITSITNYFLITPSGGTRLEYLKT